MAELTERAVPKPFPQFPRVIAALALLAFGLGRSLAHALPGSREGLDKIIPVVVVTGRFFTYLFALVGIAAALHMVRRTLRNAKLGLLTRRATALCVTAIVAALIPACYSPLPAAGSVAVAVASATLALLSAWETMRVPLTRALGVLLITAGLAAFFHVVASVLAWEAGESARYGLAVFARALSTFSVALDAITLLIAFAWVSTRPQKEAVWLARTALLVGCVLAWAVARGPRAGGGFWQLLTDRVLTRELPGPPPYVWQPLRIALEATAPLLALAAIVLRGQVPALVGAVALLLVARPVTDVPLSAVALTLAGLCGLLAARDERGVWAVLLRQDRRGSNVA